MSALWPVLWPLLTATVMGLLWRHPVWHRWIGVGACFAHVFIAVHLMGEANGRGPVVTTLGGWKPPFGIVFVADRLGAAMVLVTAVIGFAIALSSVRGIDARREAFGYHPLVQTLLGGVCGAFLTGDFFNLYVWFEVMLVSSFVLLALGGERRQMAGALHYVSYNLVASATFLIGMGTLYGSIGTLNMADVAQRLPQANPAVAAVVVGLLTVAFGVKAAVFPLFTWLPASYHTPPTLVSALFAGLLTKVGVYALIRTTTLLGPDSAPWLPGVLVVVAVLSMGFGVLGAVAQDDFRRVLSLHIVSQIGYMLFGLALMTPLALAGAVYYVLHHILVKTNLFLIGGLAKRMCGTERLAGMGGLYRRSPGLSLLFLVPALSLAGLPPLSGFWAKLFVVRAGIEADAWAGVAVALACGLLTLFSMLKLWNEAFWKPAPQEPTEPLWTARRKWMAVPVALLAIGTVGFGLFAGPLFAFSERVAEELLRPETYVQAVLGGSK